MNSRRNIDILKHMAEYCAEINEAVALFGDSLDALAVNKTYKNATAMCILQIGELAGHLSDDFRSAYPDMPWQEMKAMRNVAAHRYGKFDVTMLWGTISKNIPVLRAFCDTIIRQDQILQQNCIEAPDEESEQAPELD